MSFGAVVHATRQERQDVANASLRRRGRAKQLVVEHMPELDTDDGYIDGWAVMAVLNLWAKHGEGKTTLGQVRTERRRLLGRLKTHGPNGTVQREVTA